MSLLFVLSRLTLTRGQVLVLHGGLFSRDDTTLETIRQLDRHQAGGGGHTERQQDRGTAG